MDNFIYCRGEKYYLVSEEGALSNFNKVKTGNSWICYIYKNIFFELQRGNNEISGHADTCFILGDATFGSNSFNIYFKRSKQIEIDFGD